MRRAESKRAVRWRPAATVLMASVLIAGGLSGCSGRSQSGHGGGREAADEAFDLLEVAASALEDSRRAGLRPVESGAAGGTATVTVERVVDGDTVEVSPAISGVEDLRLIGVDTPESAIPGEEPQPLGKQAAAFTTRELAGERIRLVLGEEKFDPYGRLLGYATVPGEPMHQRKLLARGLAQTLFYEPNTAYRQEFTAIQERARVQDAGIWSLRLSQKCALEDRGNAIGEGSPGC